MASLAEATQPIDYSKYRRLDPPANRPMPFVPNKTSLEPVFSPLLRCPMPPVSITPDSLRQFYRGGEVPQHRILTSVPSSVTSGGTTSTTTFVQGSSSTSVFDNPVQNASVSTPVLNPGGFFQTSVTVSKVLSLTKITASAAARIELYSTAAAQSADLSRPAFVGGVINPPAVGTEHEVIADLYLDTVLDWALSPIAVGANDDFPQTTVLYVTITNVGTSSTAITASFTYTRLQT